MKAQKAILKLCNAYAWIIGGMAIYGIVYAGYKLSIELFNCIRYML